MNSESSSVTAPSANTPAVWVTVTMPPRYAAWRTVPRWPMRYAATIDLPWPGPSAWAAPQKSARASARRMPVAPRSRVTSDSNPEPCSSATGDVSCGGAPGPSPGSTLARARVTASGLDSPSFG